MGNRSVVLTDTDYTWRTLKSLPNNGLSISRLIQHSDSFILVKSFKSKFIIYKYYVHQDKWKILKKLTYPFSIKEQWSEMIVATFNSTTNTFYIINYYWDKLWTINIIDNTEWNEHIIDHDLDIIAITRKESYCWINNKLHFINGAITNFVMENNTFRKQYKSKPNEEYSQIPSRGSGMAYNQNKKSLILFGGHVFGVGNILDTIYEYFFETDEFINYDIVMPYASDYMFVLSVDACKFIILFIKNKILIFQTEHKRFYRSNVELPEPMENESEWQTHLYDVALVEDKLYSVVLVSGYIRRINSSKYSPNDIVNSILSMCTMEFVHLLYHKAHYKISLDTLLNQLSEM
eukprot:501303_1